MYIGDRESPEFAEPLRWLTARASVLFATDVESAEETLKLDQNPFDLLVVAQLRPGEYTHSSFDALRRAAPLAPIVCLLARYCEGETRTGNPWPGAPRIYAHEFIARVGRQFEQMDGQSGLDWAIPFTRTDEDRLLALAAICDRRFMGPVAVISEQRETASALCDFLAYAGCTVVDQITDAVDVAIWDCQGDFKASQSSFARLVARWPRTAKIVLMGFPTVAEQTAALAAGAAAVVSKPFLIEDLLWQMRHVRSVQSHGESHMANESG
jgi:hypothetical protein